MGLTKKMTVALFLVYLLFQLATGLAHPVILINDSINTRTEDLGFELQHIDSLVDLLLRGSGSYVKYRRYRRRRWGVRASL